MIEGLIFIALLVSVVAYVRAQDATRDATTLRNRLDELEKGLRQSGGVPGSATPSSTRAPESPAADAPAPSGETTSTASSESAPSDEPRSVSPESEPTPAGPGPRVPARPLAPLPASLRKTTPVARQVWDDDEPLPVVGRERPGKAIEPESSWESAPPASSSADPAGFEARFGSTWLLRIGLVLLAIAAALFSLVITPRLGPAGKVGLGYGFAALLFGAGMLSRRLKNFAQPVMAGGLSIGFFVSYSAYFIEPMRCVPVGAALGLMGAFVLAILVFSDRWRSEFTAGLAIFLGHIAAFVAARNVESESYTSLIAVVFLSGCAVMLLLRHTWIVLSLFAVVAAYASHLLWTSLTGEIVSPYRALTINLAFLSSYYFIFTASDLMWWQRRSDARLRPAPASEGKPPEGDSIESTPNVPTLGVALGPLNLVLYMALASWIYLRTEVELDRIHYFYFAMAGVQGALALGHRSVGNRDYVFYPVAAVVLLTLGFFSAFEQLALNLVLAAEALVLLVIAHQTRLRMFHLLAQATLLANFLHYWVIAPDLDPSRGRFIGGMLTAGVYFLKSGLEEIWYGRESGFAWREKPPANAFLRAISDGVREAYGLITPWLAHIHAAAGALILTDQCRRFLDPIDAAFVLALGAVGFSVLGSWYRSVPALVASAFAYGGALSVQGFDTRLGVPGFPVSEVTPGARALVNSMGAVASAAGLAILGRRGEMRRFSLALYAWLGVIFALFLIAFPASPLGLPEGNRVLLLWGSGLFAGLIAVERFSASWRKRPEIRRVIRPGFFLLEIVPGIGLALHSFALLDWRFESAPLQFVLISALASTLPLVAVVRRSAGLYAYGMGMMILMMIDMRVDHGRVALFASIPASVATFAPLLAVAWAQDLVLQRTGVYLKSTARAWAQLAIAMPYAFGMIILTGLLEIRVEPPWLFASIGGAATLLILLTAPLGLWVGGGAAIVTVVLASCWHVLLHLGKEREGAAFLIATLAFVLCPFAMERIWFVTRGRHQIASEKTRILDRAIGWALVLSPTLVLMTGVYISPMVGARWSTAAWAVYAAAIMILGFAYQAATFRRTALGVLAICLIRVFVVDIRDLERIYQAFALLVLGLCLVAIAWLYSRFSSQLRRWL